MVRQLLEEAWTEFVARLCRNFVLAIIGLGSYGFATYQALTWQATTALVLGGLFSVGLLYMPTPYHPTHREEHDMTLRELINQLVYRGTQGLETFLSSTGMPIYHEEDK